MLQSEFEDRTGKRIVPQRYAEIERIYMAAEGINKDTFCKEWKKLDGSEVVTALTREVERLTLKVQNLKHDLEMERELKTPATPEPSEQSNEEAAIEAIVGWVVASHAHLCNREGYPRGYRDGIIRAKEIVESLLTENKIDTKSSRYDNTH